MKLRKKTATLLIAILMISIFAVAIPIASAATINVPGDYSTIQAAINAASLYDTILVHPGTYSENIVIDKSLTVKSTGGAAVTIINAQGVPIAVLINGADTVATFEGFTVENYDTIGVLAGAFRDVLQGVQLGDDPIEVHILNNIIKPPTIAPPHNNNIQLGDETTGTIIGNEVSGAFLTSPDWTGSGILVAGSSGVLISNNYAHDCESGIVIVGYAEYRDAPSVDNIIEYNLVEDSECGISVQMDSTDTIIRYNDVLNNDEGIAVMAIDYPWPEHSTPSGTKIHYNNIVDNTLGVLSDIWGSDTGEVPIEQVDATLNYWGDPSGPYHTTNPGGLGDDISDNVDYSPWLGATFETTPRTYHVNPTGTIQTAVDAASDYDTVIVHAGTYSESVSVVGFTSLTIKAESAGKLDKVVKVNPTPTGFTNGFYVISDGVTIEGFEICDTNFGIWFEGSYNKFSNNYIHDITSTNVWDDGGVGISLWDLDGGSDYNEITKNRIEDIERTGILLDVAWTSYIITGNSIVRNEISNTPWGSIEVLNAEYTSINHNILSDCGDFGIALLAVYGIESNYNVIAHNEVTDESNWADIVVYGFYGGIVSHNEIHHNTAGTYADYGTDNRDFKNSWN